MTCRVIYVYYVNCRDYFDYRWNDITGSYYFFNPYSGETVIQGDHEMLDLEIIMDHNGESLFLTKRLPANLTSCSKTMIISNM